VLQSLMPWAIGLTFLGLVLWRAVHNSRKMVERTLARRPNPSEAEFMATMSGHVRVQTAAFLWETILPYVAPKLTPDPDDHLWRDLPIDEDDVTMDWPEHFAKANGLSRWKWPDWPEGDEVTVRNFGRWLDQGLIGLQDKAGAA
jgi:hypothetical protein